MSSERPYEPAHWSSLALAFANCTKTRDVNVESGQVVYTSSRDLGTHHIFEQRKTLRACTLAQSPPEPSLIAIKGRVVDDGSDQIMYTSSCDVGTCRKCEQSMIRRACTFE